MANGSRKEATVGRLRYLDVVITTGGQKWEEIAREYEEIAKTYPELIS